MLTPDSASLTRLQAWAGIALCFFAFAGPAWLIRNTDILEIKRSELAELTPDSRRELVRRQHEATLLAKWAPAWTVVFLVGGGLLLRIATPKMKKREDTEDKKAEHEAQIAAQAIRRQTATERTARAVADVEVDRTAYPEPDDQEATEPPTEAEQPPAPDGPAEPELASESAAPWRLQETLARRAVRAQQIEERVLLRLQEAVEDNWSFFDRPQFTPDAAADAALFSRRAGFPDWIVEVKYRQAKIPPNLESWTRALDRVRRAAPRGPEITGGWLIVVLDSREVSMTRPIDLPPYLRLTIINEASIDSLGIPPNVGDWPSGSGDSVWHGD